MPLDTDDVCQNVQAMFQSPETFRVSVGKALCQIKDAIIAGGGGATQQDREFLLLEDDNQVFLRQVVDDGGVLTTVDTELDGTTPYVTVGTVNPPAVVATAQQDRETLILEDDNQLFLRQIVDDGGVITVTDTELDGTTAYVPVGTVHAPVVEVTSSTLATEATLASVDGKLVSGGGTEAAALRVTLANDSSGVLSVDDNGGSLTVDDGGVPLAITSATLATEATLGSVDGKLVSGGGTEAAALRVTLANDSSGVLSVDDNGGSITVDDGGVPLTITNAELTSIDGKLVSGGGTEAAALRVTLANDSTGVLSVDDNGGSITVDDGGVPLAITSATLATEATLASVDGKLVSGGGTEAAALRVTIANDSTGVVSIDDNGGSVTVDGSVDLDTAAASFDTESVVAFGSIGGAFALLHTPGGNLRYLEIFNDTDATLDISFNAGGAHHWTIKAGEGRTWDFHSHQRFQSAAIHVRHDGSAPTTGEVRAMGYS